MKTNADLAMERLVAEDAKTYRMDVATFAHLTGFCETFFREDEATEKRDRIVSELESWAPEDVEYSLSHGWPHVVNLLGL